MQWGGVVNSVLGESGGTTYHPNIPQQKGAEKGGGLQRTSLGQLHAIVPDSDVKLSYSVVGMHQFLVASLGTELPSEQFCRCP